MFSLTRNHIIGLEKNLGWLYPDVKHYFMVA